MANTITDARTQVDSADTTTGWDDLSGVAQGNQDVDVFIQGTASVGEIISNSINGELFDAGSAQDWSNNVFYIWINCGIVGILDTKTNAGFTIRFCGATVSDWFEVYVGGSDSWPAAVSGGWVQFVVDIEDARAVAIVGTIGGTNGTTPATTAIRYVGWSGITASVMTKMVDNTWVDEIRRLPDGTAGILVQGRNGGSTDWTSSDIASQLGIGVGTFLVTAGGAYKINTSIQIGISDTTTHGFTDTTAIWLWDNQEFAPNDLYVISALGASGGTTNVTMGVKNGTGNAATGSQGLIISAAATGVRWDMDFDDPDLDLVAFYGCQFIHGGAFEFADVAVSCISTVYVDCTSATISNSEQLRISVIDANTADGVAFMITDDMSDIVNSSFLFSDGHAIELNATTPTTQANVGNLFSGYTNTVDSTDAALLNSAAGALTINSSGGSDLQSDSYRNTGGGSVTINNNISVTFDKMRDLTEVRIYAAGTTTELDGIEDATAGSADNRNFAASIAASTSVDYTMVNVLYEIVRVETFTWPTADQTINIAQKFDRNNLNPV